MAPFTVRALEEADAEAAGDVNFLAFYQVAVAHGHPPVVSSPFESRGYIRHLLRFDPMGGLVAEDEGEIVGVAWVHPRGPVATIGPVAVDPRAQGRGVGRRLVERCLEVAGAGIPQVRLVQESFNTVALGLYLRTGFRVVAPLLELALPATSAVAAPRPPGGVVVRAATAADQTRLVARDARAFGAPRPQSVALYLRRGRALVAERSGALTGYGFAIGFRGLAYLGSASADDPETLLLIIATLAAELVAGRVTVRALVPATDRRLVEGLAALGFR